MVLHRCTSGSVQRGRVLGGSLTSVSRRLGAPLASVLVAARGVLSSSSVPIRVEQSFIVSVTRGTRSVGFLMGDLLALSVLSSKAIGLGFKSISIRGVVSRYVSHARILTSVHSIEVRGAIGGSFGLGYSFH